MYYIMIFHTFLLILNYIEFVFAFEIHEEDIMNTFEI